MEEIIFYIQKAFDNENLFCPKPILKMIFWAADINPYQIYVYTVEKERKVLPKIDIDGPRNFREICLLGNNIKMFEYYFMSSKKFCTNYYPVISHPSLAARYCNAETLYFIFDQVCYLSCESTLFIELMNYKSKLMEVLRFNFCKLFAKLIRAEHENNALIPIEIKNFLQITEFDFSYILFRFRKKPVLLTDFFNLFYSPSFRILISQINKFKSENQILLIKTGKIYPKVLGTYYGNDHEVKMEICKQTAELNFSRYLNVVYYDLIKTHKANYQNYAFVAFINGKIKLFKKIFTEQEVDISAFPKNLVLSKVFKNKIWQICKFLKVRINYFKIRFN